MADQEIQVDVDQKTGQIESVKPENYMTLSIVGTVLGLCSPCCIGLITGIIAIVYSSQVDSKFNAGDYEGSAKSAKNAKTFAYISIGLGILGLIGNGIYYAMNGTSMIEQYQQMYQSQTGGN